MSVVLNDRLRTTVNFLLPNGVQYQNVYTHTRSGIAVITDASHVSALNDWVEAAYGHLWSIIEENTVEQLCFVDKIGWSGTQWEVTEHIGTFSPTFTPTGAQAVCPNQVSPFVTYKTARPKSVGRKFLFPSLVGHQDEGILTAPVVAFIVSYADDTVNDIELTPGNDLIPGVVRTDFDEWLPYTLAVVTDLVGTQRRRRPGYGS